MRKRVGEIVSVGDEAARLFARLNALLLATATAAMFAASSTLGCEAGGPPPTTGRPVENMVVASATGSRTATVDMPVEGPAPGLEVSIRSPGAIIVDVRRQLIPDPLAAPFDNDFPYGEVYSGLVKIGDSEDAPALPDLAESWIRSDDGLSYTFQLRDGLVFSNGSPLTAADVKWSWERALDPQFATNRTAEVFGAISGAEQMMEGEASALSGVAAIDDSTLLLTLAAPVSHFPYLLADPIASVLSHSNVRNWGTLNWVEFQKTLAFGAFDTFVFDELPVGTGPFRVASYGWPSDAELEPNPHYWGDVPAITRVTLGQLDADADADADGNRQEARSADYDFRPVDRGLFQSSLDVEDYDEIASSTAPRVEFLALNTALPPFDNLDFRLALFHAANRSYPSNVPAREVHSEEFLSPYPAGAANSPVNIDGLPSATATGLIPPGMAGHRAPTGVAANDLELAEMHLRRSSYVVGSDAPSLELLDTRIPFRQFFTYFSRHWIDWLGIDVSANFVSQLPIREFNDAYESGTLQMIRVLVEPRYPDPCAILCRIPDLFGPNARSDETELLREMLHDAAATADRAARIAKYQAIEAHILDRALVIPAYWDDGTVYELVRPYISGYKVPAYGGSRYEDVVVDTTHPDYPAGR